MKVKADFKVSFWATKRLFSRPNRFAFFKPSRLVKWLHESTPTPLDRLTFLHGCGLCCKKHDCGDGKPESLSICVPCKVAACSSDSKDTSATRSTHVEQHALMPLELFLPKNATSHVVGCWKASRPWHERDAGRRQQNMQVNEPSILEISVSSLRLFSVGINITATPSSFSS